MSKTERPTDRTVEHSRRRATPTIRLGSVYLPTDVEMKLRLAATSDRRSISDVVTEAVRAWLAQRRDVKRSPPGK